MPEERPQVTPVIGVYVDVLHGTPQARLHSLRMPPEDVHDECPAQRGKCRPRVLQDKLSGVLVRYEAPPTADLLPPGQYRPVRVTSWPHTGLLHFRHDEQLRIRKTHARKDVNNNLLRDARVRPSKHDIPAEQAGDEDVVAALAPLGVGLAEGEQGAFVDEGEEGEVAGVLAGRAQDEPGLLAQAALPEEEDHHKRVREAHFAAVHDAIADALDEGEDVVVAGVEDDALEGVLGQSVLDQSGRKDFEDTTYL